MPVAPVHGAGLDDLDLEGNWAAGGDGGEADAVAAPKKAKAAAKKKRKAALEAAAAAEAAAPAEEAGGGGKAKKRRKKGRKGDARDEEPDKAASGEELCAWAAGRLQAAWAAEAKARRLAPLEAGEVAAAAAWFAPTLPASPLARLPWQLSAADADDAALRTLRTISAASKKGAAKPPPPAPKGAAVLVLCLSTERVFGALGEIKAAWSSVRPLALAAHGGGRKKDQVARQAKALEAGVAVAVGTPGRCLRLVEEGHVALDSLEAVVLDLARDRKQRDLLALPETRRDLFELLQRHLLPLMSKGAMPRLALCGSSEFVAGGGSGSA